MNGVLPLEARVAVPKSGTEHAIPVCAGCGRVRLPEKDPFEQLSWVRPEVDVGSDMTRQLSHGLCPECMRRYYPDYSIVPRE